MLKSIIIFWILSNCVLTTLLAQSEVTAWETYVDNEKDLAYWQEHYEDLSELAEHPFNINTVTKEQLEQLPFLSDRLIENILYYVYKYNPIKSENELWGIEGMDYQTQNLLRQFIYVGEATENKQKLTLKNLLKYNKQELLTRIDIPLNKKAGYAPYPPEELAESPNKKYYGDAFYHNLRYRFQYRNQVFIGFTAEKDAGEPFFKLYNRKGYDFYSAYVFLQDIKQLKTLVAGNYKVSFGYGLVMNTGFSFGKSGNRNNIHRYGSGIGKYTSVNEANYLQGIGATYRLSAKWNLSAWYSFRNQDARVDNLFINSLKTDGYHRLKSDIDKKNTISNHLVGSNLTYNGKYVEYGLTAVYNIFNMPLNPDFRPYNRYYPRGRDFYNMGIFYKFFFHKFIFSGETAVDKQGSLATLSALSYSPSVNTVFTLINRYYDKRYQSIYANAFSENSRIQNEAGTYIGLETNLFSRVKLLCYADFFYFPYRKYQVDKDKTVGMEGGFQLSYSPVNSLSMLIKYGYKNKAKNYTSPSDSKYVIPDIRQRLHCQLTYSPNEQTLLKTVVEYVHSSRWKQSVSHGLALGGTVKTGWKRFPVQAVLSGVWFKTSDYSSRIYMYEPGLLYAFSMTSFYGEGLRMAVNLRYAVHKRLIIQAKWGMTNYSDRDRIGSGAEEIMGNKKYDLQFQARLKW